MVVNEYQHTHEFLEALDRWSYSLAGCAPDLDRWGEIYDLELLGKQGLSLIADMSQCATNRYDNVLAFGVTLAFQGPPRPYQDREKEPFPGNFIFLPRTSRSAEDDLLVLLRDFLGTDVMIPEPEWLGEAIAPGQEQVDRDIAEIVGAMERQQELQELLERKNAERVRIRAPLQLLYERGDALESTVRDILARLGAQVEAPEHPGKEDGWIRVDAGAETLEGVLEVKGTRNEQFDENGLRQLLEWVHRGIQQRGKKLKGVFVGNSATERALVDRPAPFSSSWRRTAELQEFVAITSGALYEIYCLDHAGLLNREDFWREFFGTAGVFDHKAFIDRTTTVGAHVS